MTYVDASAIVALLCQEASMHRIAAAMDRADTLITSPVALFEVALALVRKRAISHGAAEREIADFLLIAGVEVIANEAELWRDALSAHARFGKGRHAARLNLGDCFAYAAAKSRNAAILFVGDDFTLTDLPDALAGI